MQFIHTVTFQKESFIFFYLRIYFIKKWQTTKDQIVSAKVSERHVSHVDTVNPASHCWYSAYLVCVYCRVGKVVNIIAKVNRAFTSSMEVSVFCFFF